MQLCFTFSGLFSYIRWCYNKKRLNSRAIFHSFISTHLIFNTNSLSNVTIFNKQLMAHHVIHQISNYRTNAPYIQNQQTLRTEHQNLHPLYGSLGLKGKVRMIFNCYIFRGTDNFMILKHRHCMIFSWSKMCYVCKSLKTALHATYYPLGQRCIMCVNLKKGIIFSRYWCKSLIRTNQDTPPILCNFTKKAPIGTYRLYFLIIHLHITSCTKR